MPLTDLRKKTLINAKLTVTLTDKNQKYKNIDASELKNNLLFSSQPLAEGFNILYFSDQEGKNHISNNIITDKGIKKVFIQILPMKDDKYYRNKTKISPLELTIVLPLVDSNDDGVPDEWSINGFTVENDLIVKWKDEEHSTKNFVKYYSDPYHKSTTGDPYSDIDKVLGKLDQVILTEARNPLVAAFPFIGLNLEKIIITKNITLGQKQDESDSTSLSKTLSVSISNSNSISNKVGVGAYFSSPFDFGVSESYSFENMTTITTGQSDSETTSRTSSKNLTDSLEMNTAETAFLSGNIRYINAGTAPIYHALPTLNFVLGLGKNSKTIATITAKTNTSVDCLLPNTVYPDLGQNSVAWNTSDDFNSQSIKLNFDQVNAIGNGEQIQIQTLQTSGYYKKYSFNEEVDINESQKWDYVLNDIYNRTACITLALKNGNIQQRRVYAKNNYDNQKQSFPEISLGKAIEIAFKNAKVEDNGINYQSLKPTTTLILFDYETKVKIEELINRTKNLDFFEIILSQGMNIIIQETEDKKLSDGEINNFNSIVADIKKTANYIYLGNEFDSQKRSWDEIVKYLKWYIYNKNKENIDIIRAIKIESNDKSPLDKYTPPPLPTSFLDNSVRIINKRTKKIILILKEQKSEEIEVKF